jgi:hypothetical protein
MKPRHSRLLCVLALVAVVGSATLAVPQSAPARTTVVVAVPSAPAPVVVPPPLAIVSPAPVVVPLPPRVVTPAPVIVVPHPRRPHGHRWHHWSRW